MLQDPKQKLVEQRDKMTRLCQKADVLRQQNQHTSQQYPIDCFTTY
jgi:hypothetical protein